MNSEDNIISKLKSYSLIDIQRKFIYTSDTEGEIYIFREIQNQKNYITINKTRHPFMALVNADFDFKRPLGSNNCHDLLDIGQKFIKAFGLEVNW